MHARTPDQKIFEPSGLARLPLVVLDRAAELGLDRDMLMREAGISEAELADPDARVPIRKLRKLARVASDHLGDSDLPLRVMCATPLRDFGLVGYMMSNSRTLRQALDRLVRYSRIVTDAMRLRWVHAPDRSQMVAEPTMEESDLIRGVSDARVGFIVAAARELTAQDLVPLGVLFPYPPPHDPARLESVLRCPLGFNHPSSVVEFSPAQLDLAVGGDAALGGYLEQLSQHVLELLPDPTSFQDRVRRAVWAVLGDGPPELSRIAADLAVSARTLQRRLREEGTTYAALLDGLRRDFALRLLRDRNLAVYEIAFLLGYTEPSTFQRAFRRWTGRSPRQYRRDASA